MEISYLQLQLMQIVFGLVLFGVIYSRLRKRGTPISQVPFLIVLIGYVLASAISNALRELTYDWTALRKIGALDYLVATVWWCASVCLTVVFYFAGSHSKFGRVKKPWAEHAAAPMVMKTLSLARTPYIIVGFLVLGSIYLNPFRNTDFGVLTARSESDLVVGGLLTASLLAALFSGISIPLFLSNIWLGLGAVGISIVLFVGTGSKGMAPIFLLMTVWTLIRYRSLPTLRQSRYLFRLLLPLFALSIPLVLLYSVRNRFQTDSIDLTQAISAALGRFTQQDVAAVIQQSGTWREAFREEYLRGVILSFVPGFLWPGKPINPAYAINSLYSYGFTAASPSLFGSLLIGTSDWAYWLVLPVISYGIGIFDNYFAGTRSAEIRVHYEWYLIYSWCALFEGNWVIWVVQILTLLLWRWVLFVYSTRARNLLSLQSGSALLFTAQQPKVKWATSPGQGV
jgi:hypothetical protein